MKPIKDFAIYQFCNKSLDYKSITNKVSISVIVLLLMAGSIGYLIRSYQEPKLNIDHEKLVMLLNQDPKEKFTEANLKQYLKDIHIAFPDIVFSQAVLESGNFKSNIFRINHNMFGMKLAKQRPTLAIDEENGHAVYNNWKESVLDYALFQSRYLSVIKTKELYLEYLRNNYAEDSSYVHRLNCIIRTVHRDTCITH